MRKTSPAIAGFEDGKGPQVKEFGQPLVARKGEETDCPLCSPADTLLFAQ